MAPAPQLWPNVPALAAGFNVDQYWRARHSSGPVITLESHGRLVGCIRYTESFRWARAQYETDGEKLLYGETLSDWHTASGVRRITDLERYAVLDAMLAGVRALGGGYERFNLAPKPVAALEPLGQQRQVIDLHNIDDPYVPVGNTAAVFETTSGHMISIKERTLLQHHGDKLIGSLRIESESAGLVLRQSTFEGRTGGPDGVPLSSAQQKLIVDRMLRAVRLTGVAARLG